MSIHLKTFFQCLVCQIWPLFTCGSGTACRFSTLFQAGCYSTETGDLCNSPQTLTSHSQIYQGCLLPPTLMSHSQIYQGCLLPFTFTKISESYKIDLCDLQESEKVEIPSDPCSLPDMALLRSGLCVLPSVSGLALKYHQSYSEDPQTADVVLTSGRHRLAQAEGHGCSNHAAPGLPTGPAHRYHTCTHCACTHIHTHTSSVLNPFLCGLWVHEL